MNNIEIVVETFNDYKNYEQWLFGSHLPEKVNISIFCRENAISYFYTTVLVGDYWLVVTDE